MTGLALAAAAGSVVLAAAPALLRAAGLALPAADLAPPSIANHGRGPHAEVQAPEAEEAEDEAAGRPEDPGVGVAPGQGPPSWAVPRTGFARKDLELRDHAGGGLIVGEISAGALVTIVKEQGEWVLVAQNGPDDMSIGWAPRSGVAIR
jgi:hypothetical protein